MQEPESLSPKSELTLDSDEFINLISFLVENYEPFRAGAKRYIPINEEFDSNTIANLKAVFRSPDKNNLLSILMANDILPNDLLIGLQNARRVRAIEQFEQMLGQNLTESKWQQWFKDNEWVLGSDFVRILSERDIDTRNISDYLVQAYDGFLDIIEIKRPEGILKFWADKKDHDNYIPSQDLTKAIFQSIKYVNEIEREANSLKFLERVGYVKTVKPRITLIFGRSNDWDNDQKESYRILNSSYHNLSILTYDHVLSRAKRILGMKYQ